MSWEQSQVGRKESGTINLPELLYNDKVECILHMLSSPDANLATFTCVAFSPLSQSMQSSKFR